jgi:hypothetical protein
MSTSARSRWPVGALRWLWIDQDAVWATASIRRIRDYDMPTLCAEKPIAIRHWFHELEVVVFDAVRAAQGIDVGHRGSEAKKF